VKNINPENKILTTFLELTSETYPYGKEDDLMAHMIECDIVPRDIQRDQQGNYFYKIGESRTIFTAHLDTVGKKVSVFHLFDGDFIKTDGKTILGADDKAGVTILSYMIQNKIPGLYYFFKGEECGCVGSSMLALKSNMNKDYDRMISFDRKGYSSVITHQGSIRCCSDEFANKLSEELNYFGFNYRIDTGGIYTDSAEFSDQISECTNISVGYFSEHTTSERQNILHLENLANACLYIEWEKLPKSRDFNEIDYYHSSYHKPNVYHVDNFPDYTYDDYYNDYHYLDGYGHQNTDKKKNKTRRGKKNKKYLTDNTTVININPKKNYSYLVDKIVKDNISLEELEIIKEQYLDINNAEDRSYYEYLVGNLIC